jgi:periplasmic protein CpxP/Spy
MRWIVIGFCAGLVFAPAAQAQEAVSAQLIKLHDDLNLSPDQEGAWRAYATAIAPSAQTDARHRATGDLLPMVPTPRRIALVEANMADDQADFRRQAQAVLAFYDRLTANQQRTFDRDTVPAPSSEGSPDDGPPGAPPGR